MREEYKSVFDKMKLSEEGKDRAKALFYEVDERKEKTMGWRKVIRPAAVAAASLALIVAANAVVPALHKNITKAPENVAEKTDSVLDKYFTVTAYAKELTKTGKVFSEDYSGIISGICGNADGSSVSYNFEFPVEVKGKNIDTVTYTINDGAFCINHPKGKNIVVAGKKLDKMLNVPGESKEAEEKEVLTYLDEQYHSFTVKYDNQINEETCIDIVGTSDIWGKEKREQYKALNYDIANSTVEEDKKAHDFLMKDIKITCMVTYRDGSTESKEIALSNKIMKYSEVTGEKVPEKKDTPCVVHCFSLK